MILILCQEIKTGEESRTVREGVREKIGFELDLKGQGVVSGAEGRWEGISDGGNSKRQAGGGLGQRLRDCGSCMVQAPGAALPVDACWEQGGPRWPDTLALRRQSPGSRERKAWGGAPWQGPCRVA